MVKKPSTKLSLASIGNATVITSENEVDVATLIYAEALRECERIQLAFDDEVARLHAGYIESFRPHAERANVLEAAIVAYARGELAILNDAKPKPTKTVQLHYARVKFSRDSDRVVVKVPTDVLLKNLRRFRLGNLIQKKEYVEAADLRNVRAELHERVGFAIEPTPSVGKIEIDLHALPATVGEK